MKIHLEQPKKPFACSNCGKVFYDKANLKIHSQMERLGLNNDGSPIRKKLPRGENLDECGEGEDLFAEGDIEQELDMAPVGFPSDHNALRRVSLAVVSAVALELAALPATTSPEPEVMRVLLPSILPARKDAVPVFRKERAAKVREPVDRSDAPPSMDEFIRKYC